MKKIITLIGTLILTIALIGYLFDLPEYSLFAQLEKIQLLDFINPLENLTILINKVADISEWGTLNIEWYEYIVVFFKWLGNLLMIPITLIKDMALNIYYGLQAILIALGFF